MKDQKQTWIYVILYAMLFMLLSASALICMETIWRGSFSEAVMWLGRMSGEFACDVLIIALLEAVLYLLIGRMLVAVGVTNLLFMVLALIQHYKMVLRGDVFVLADLALAAEAAGVMGKYTIEVPWHVYIPCAALLVMPLYLAGMKLRGIWKKRILCAVLCSILLVGSGYFVLDSTGKQIFLFEEYYKQHGLLNGLVHSRPKAEKAPEDYSQERVESVLSDYESPDDIQVMPDILFVMSESLYDIMQIEGIEISEDPLAYTRSLQQNYWGGHVYTQPLGGGTAHTEYEVLTGYRSSMTKITAYMDKIRPNTGSIAELLTRYGYHTVAMHPNTGKFYNREHVYPKLGFNEMVFISDMSPVNDRVGPFPSDDYLFKEIIRTYENRPEDQPWFSYVVTYQNHGGYDYEYDRKNISVRDGKGQTMPAAQTYVNALQASDEALEKLITYFDNQERPVVIVVFGDHAPNFSYMGYRPNENQSHLMHMTPLLIYSNYGFTMPEETPSTLAAYRLGATVLNALGFRSDAYYNYLADPTNPSLCKENGMVIGEEGLAENLDLYTRIDSELALIRYDRIYGNNFGRKDTEGNEK